MHRRRLGKRVRKSFLFIFRMLHMQNVKVYSFGVCMRCCCFFRQLGGVIQRTSARMAAAKASKEPGGCALCDSRLTIGSKDHLEESERPGNWKSERLGGWGGGLSGGEVPVATDFEFEGEDFHEECGFGAREEFEEIGGCDQAEQGAFLVGDGDAIDLVSEHDGGDLCDGGIGLACDHVGGHDLVDGQRGDVESFGGQFGAQEDITIGEHTDHLRSFEDGHMAKVELHHQVMCITQIIVSVQVNDGACHGDFYFHDFLLFGTLGHPPGLVFLEFRSTGEDKGERKRRG